MAAASPESLSSESSNRPIPGILDLPLTFNNGQMNSKQEVQAKRKLNRRLPLLKRELKDRPIRHAVRNFVGALYYRLGQSKDAIQCWRTTIKEDPNNLNAIQDLSTAHAEIGLKKQSDDYREILEGISSKLSHNEKEQTLVYARCQAEQAYCAIWDVHTKSWLGHAIMAEKINKFKSALEMVEGFISQEEKEDWYLAIGQAYERLSHMYFRDSKDRDYLQSIDEAARYIHFSLTTSHHTLHKAEAWTVLGNALTYDTRYDAEFTPSFINANYLDEWNNPALCYDKALKLDPGNSWILGCYGNLHLKQKRYDEAIDVLDKSIKNDPSPSSWFSYSIRSDVYKRLAKMTKDRTLRGQYFCQAEQDAKMVKESNPNARGLLLCGELASNQEKYAATEGERDDLSLEALQHFLESLETQDGRQISYVHLKKGESLLKHDRYSAIQSFKMAFDTSTSPCFRTEIAEQHVIPTMLEEYQAQGKSKDLLAELAFWIVHSNEKGHVNLFCSIGTLAQHPEYQHSILDVIEYLVENPCTQDGEDTMLSDGLQILKQTRFKYSNYQRLCSLQEKHRTKPVAALSATPSLPERQPPETARHSPNFLYDFFVISSSSASNTWACNSLLPAMECNFYSFRGYLEERNKELGRLSLTSQCEAITKSAYVVIVLTQPLTSRNLHLFESACQTKDTSQIVVLKLKDISVPRQMQHLKLVDFCGAGTHSNCTRPQWTKLAKILLREPRVTTNA